MHSPPNSSRCSPIRHALSAWADMLKTDYAFLGLLVLPAILAAGGLVTHQLALALGLVGLGFLLILALLKPSSLYAPPSS